MALATPLKGTGRHWLVLPAAALATLALAAASVVLSAGPLVPLGVLGVVLAVALLVLRPELLAPLVVVGFALQPEVKFNYTSQAGPAKDAIIVIGVLALGVGLVRRHEGIARADRTLLALLALFAAAYVLNPAGGHGPGWASMARLVLEAFALLLAGYLSTDAGATWRWAAWSAVGVGVLESVIGIHQQLLGVKVLVEQHGYAYGQQVRTTSSGQLRSFGTLDDPFNYAAITVLGLVCALHLVRRPLLRLPLAALLAVGVLVSYDRTAFVLVAAVVVLDIGRRHPSSARALTAALVVAGIALLVSRSPEPAPTTTSPDAATTDNGFVLSLNGRTSTWLRVIRGPDDILFGRGAGEIGAGAGRAGQHGVVQPARYVPGVAPPVDRNVGLTSLDSTYFETLADIGLVGVLLLLALGARVRALLRAGVKGPDSAAVAGIALLAVIAVDGVTRTSLVAFPFGFVALFLLGAALGAAAAPSALPRRRPGRFPRQPAVRSRVVGRHAR